MDRHDEDNARVFATICCSGAKDRYFLTSLLLCSKRSNCFLEIIRLTTEKKKFVTISNAGTRKNVNSN
jgi:hypothetical protein